MAGRYIPPALRNKAAGSAEPSAKEGSKGSTGGHASQPGLYSLADIQAHFWDASHKAFNSECTTLNASAADPASLSYVELFRGANPRWTPDHIIFVKSNLDFLTGEQQNTGSGAIARDANAQDTTTSQTTSSPTSQPLSQTESTLPQAIAVFEQADRNRSKWQADFHFAGYFKIARCDFLEPGSEQLVRMLQQKWEAPSDSRPMRHRERDAAAWENSLRQRWAVVKFEKDEEAERIKGPLVIERIEKESMQNRENKSVNELLRELRGQGSSKAEESSSDENVKPPQIIAAEAKGVEQSGDGDGALASR